MVRGLLVVALSCLPFSTGGSGQDWDAADRATVRLKPAEFPNVPLAVRRELERRGCTIPQPYGSTRPVNIISGRFMSASQADWAALCSQNRVSTILVFAEGKANQIRELGRQDDSGKLQIVNPGEIGYSRMISVATATFIRDHHDPKRSARLPRLDHEGIDDAFIEKGSVVWFWSGGNWLELAGSD